MKVALEREHFGKWALLSGGELVGICETCPDANKARLAHSGPASCLLKEIGASSPFTQPPYVPDPSEGEPTDALGKDLAAYERMRAALEREHLGKWALLCDAELAEIYATLAEASKATAAHTGGPCHTREIGAPRRIMIPSVFAVRGKA